MPSNYLPTSYQEFIHLSRYSRWLPEKERRETWDETVARYFDFFTEHLKETVNFTLSKELRTELEQAVLGLRVMPSMRCIMTAGEALKRENIAGYNCSYVAVDRPQAFDEILYILMNGTGAASQWNVSMFHSCPRLLMSSLRQIPQSQLLIPS